MVMVKICGLTNYRDARHAADCGADLLGFIFVPTSKRYLAAEQAASIIADLRAAGCTAAMVGVLADIELQQARALISQCKLDYIQLHGHETPGYAEALGCRVLVARRISDHIPWDELAAYQASAFVLDTCQAGSLGGTGSTWNWQALANAPQDIRLILAGGLRPGNVANALAAAAACGVAPWGVDVSSGVERSPGLKDAARVAAFIQAAKGAA